MFFSSTVKNAFLRAMKERGCAIDRDNFVSIGYFDEIDDSGSVVGCFLESIYQRSAELILERLRKPHPSENCRILIQPQSRN